MASVGIDFGTTNSVLAIAGDDGSVSTARFGTDSAFRSILCFWEERQAVAQVLQHAVGPAAIEAWLGAAADCRLVMSMKSYLAQASFSETRIFGRRHTLEDLIALLLRALLAGSGVEPGELRVVAGRPVRFAGERADDALGAARLTAAFAAAGMPAITLALEPEAAGWHFARSLDADATVLVGDFGGGTSDFSVLRYVRGRGVVSLGHAGIGIAGDVFDARIMEQVVAPRLGKGGTYRPGQTALPVPPHWYRSLARWHLLSLMHTPRMLREIREVAARASHPHRLEAFARLIAEELGFELNRAVTRTKAELSTRHSAELHFEGAGILIEEEISREAFEAWIEPDLARLAATVDEALATAGTAAGEITRVFLTGGTAFVPAVRRLFEQRFGADRIAGGREFLAIAEGLALMGAVA
jgi:hypothetical chaperone protein